MRRTIEFDLRELSLENSRLHQQLVQSKLLYPFILTRDVSNMIMPIPGHNRLPTFSIGLKYANEEGAAKMLAKGIRQKYGFGGNLEETVCEFVSSCARGIMHFGEQYYEIVYAEEPSTGDHGISFHLATIPPGSMHHSLGRLVQRIPVSIQKARSLPRDLAVDQERIVRFGPPKELERELAQVVNNLASLSSERTLKVGLGSMMNRTPIDISSIHRSQEIAIIDATRIVGWLPHGLGPQSGLLTEHYWWHRQISFERFLAEFRSTILATLNSALGSVGKKLGFNLQLNVTGLKSAAEIEATRAHLLCGDWTLEQIRSAISQR